VVPGILIARALGRVGWSCGFLENIYDGRLVSYLLEWGYEYLRGARLSDSIWSPPFFFPEGNVLAYSETSFAAYPFYVPARWIGLDTHQSVLFSHLAQLFLTPLVTYACGRWLGLGRLAAMTCAFTFGWSWARHHHHVHPQLAMGWVIPLFFTFLFKGLVDRRARWLIGSLWALTTAYYMAMYYAYFLVLLAVPLMVAMATWRRERVPAYLRSFGQQLRGQGALRVALGAVAAALPLALLTYGSLHYLAASRVLGGGDPAEARMYRASLASWVRPDPRNLVWGRLADLVPQDAVAGWEKQTFLGGLALVFCAALPLMVRSRPVRDWLDKRSRRSMPGADVLVCVAVAVPITMLFFSELPNVLLPLKVPVVLARRFLPGLGALRASARICLLLSFFTAFIAALWVEFLGTLAAHEKWLRAVSLAVAALLVLENLPPTPVVADRCGPDRPWTAIEPRIRELAAASGAGTVTFLPLDMTSIWRRFEQVPAMNVALHCDLRTINGYTGHVPPRMLPLTENPNPRKLPCQPLASILDQVHAASGKPTLVWIEQSGPLGPPLYPVESVTSCLRRCLAGAEPVPINVEGHAGLVLATTGGATCQ
jgi:hypothetical protein